MSRMLKALDRHKTVILVCDVQERFRHAVYGFGAMCSSINRLLRAATMLEIPVITTEQNPRALGNTATEVGLANLPEHLNLGEFPKTRFSMLIPAVENIIRDKGFEHVLLVGIESHVCVLQTTLALLRSNPGIGVYVLADAVSSVNRQEIPVAFERLRGAGAVIGTTESVLFELMNDSSDPLFKPFAMMVKGDKENTKRSLETFLDSKNAQQPPATDSKPT